MKKIKTAISANNKLLSHSIIKILVILYLIFSPNAVNAQQSVDFNITKNYLNVPVGNKARMKLIKLVENGKVKREFPVQLAEDSVDYWIFIDVSEFKGTKINLESHAKETSLKRIYQDDKINGEDSLYKESNRPQFHFTVKRGWSNDINGPVYFGGQYHLFWQAFPFGLLWNRGFMYWGHAISNDLIHWKELDPALMLDSLGSPWSGTAVIDKNNDAGFGKDALILFYCCYDRISFKQVQCIAYSTDGGKTFQRYKGNPVIDSNWELGSNDTRDPKVFWYEPAKKWVMILFEKDGLSFFNSTDMKQWQRTSHFKGLFECPDFFELPVDGDSTHKKWVLHGGNADYYIGDFDGKTFTPTSSRLRYAEGKGWNGEDLLYAAESFYNMPDNRIVQMAWGRIQHPNMPFTQMMLFPTEFSLITVNDTIKMVANPVHEIESLRTNAHLYKPLTIEEANKELASFKSNSLDVKVDFNISNENDLRLRFHGDEIINLSALELTPGNHTLELLIDRTVAEVFIDHGNHYIIKNIRNLNNDDGLVFESYKYGPTINSLNVYEMKSIW